MSGDGDGVVVNLDEPEEGDEGETYVDIVSARVRSRRGARKKSHGPWSGAEKRMSRAFQYLMAEMHWMDGELADLVATRFAAQFAASQIVIRAYSYKNLPDPGPEDWERLREELGMAEQAPVEEEFNLGDLT